MNYKDQAHAEKYMSLRPKTNILKILPSKTDNFQMKNSDIFHISAQNINCGYSLEDCVYS